MKPVKFIALVICALTAMLSVPHVTLWGFSVGSGAGYAINTNVAIIKDGFCKGPSGILADDHFALVNGEYKGQIRCAVSAPTSQNTYYKVACNGIKQDNKWKDLGSAASSSQDTCASDCKNSGDFASYCTEPRLVVHAEIGRPGATQTISDGSTAALPSSYTENNGVIIRLKSNNENTHQDKLTKGSRSLNHVIQYQIIRNGNKAPQSPASCGENPSCSRTLYREDLRPGDRVEYWSEIILEETNGASTYIRAPSPPSYSRDYKFFTISGSSSSSSGTLTITSDKTSARPGDTITLTSTSSLSGQDISKHDIIYEAHKNNVLVSGTNRRITCSGTSDNVCRTTVTIQSGWNADTLKYRSEVTKAGETSPSLRAPPTDFNSMPISSITTPPPAPSPSPNCGNNKIDAGEECDSSQLGSSPPACSPGPLACYPSTAGANACKYDKTKCAPDTSQPNSATVQINPSAPAANTQFTITFILSAPLASNSVLKYQISGQSFVNQLTRSNCVGNSCTGPVNGLPAGTYNVIASLVTGTVETPLSLNPSSFSVAAAPTAPGSPATANQCCVTKSGTTYTYDDTTAEVSCTGADKFFYPTSCANAQNTVCNNFCQQDQKVPSGGSCGTQPTDPNIPRYSICRSGVCVCNTGGSYDTRNVPCNQACFTSSSSYFYLTSAYSAQRTQAIPIGQCTSNPEAIVMSAAVFGQATTAGQYVQQPQILQPAGAYHCPPNENCVCTYIDFSSFSARNSRPTLPGTETAAGWKHPRDVTASAPKKNPNEHVCGTATNATITASLGPAGTTQASGTTSTVVSRLIQAGDTVTITGKVTKLSEACAGYKRTCIAMKPLACEVKNRVLWTTLDYRDCPADFPEDVHKEGGGKKWNKAMIASIIAAAATWGLGSIGAIGSVGGASTASDAVFWGAVSAGANAAINGMQCGTSYAGANYAPALYMAMRQFADDGRDEERRGGPTQPGTTGGTDGAAGSITTATSGQLTCNDCVGGGGTWCFSQTTGHCETGEIGCKKVDEQQESSTSVVSGCPALTGSATAKPTFTVTGMSPHDAPPKPSTGSSASANTAGVIVSSVLGSIPSCPSAEDIQGCFSVCGRTYETEAGPDPLCGEGGPVIGFSEAEYKCGQGTCGGFASKGVKIEIRGPDGSVAISDTTTTDANGDFSYTFTAPAADGEFVAVLSVPKG